MAIKEAVKKKIKVQKEVEVTLPDIPKVKEGEMAMRMITHDGQVRDCIGKTMGECIESGRHQARELGFDFQAPREAPKHVESWERVA